MDMSASVAHMIELQARKTHALATIESAKMVSVPGLYGAPTMVRLHPDQPDPSKADVERAKVTLAKTEESIQALLTRIGNLEVEGLADTARTAADKRDEAEKARKKREQDEAHAGRILSEMVLRGTEQGMNPASKFALQENAKYYEAKALDPHADTTNAVMAESKGWNELFDKRALELRKQRDALFNFLYGDPSKKDQKTNLEEAMLFGGISPIAFKDYAKVFALQDAIGREDRSNRIANVGMDRRYNLRMSGISDGPQNMMYNVYRAADLGNWEALNNKNQSFEAAKGAEDRVLQERRATDLYARETKQIEYDTELKIAEIKKQQREEDRKDLGELFDAMNSGQRGAVGKLFKSKLVGMERTMFTNALETPFFGSER
jgi:hypothetical protein